ASQIGELGGARRERAQSLEPGSVLDRPLVEAFEREIDSFERRSRIRVTLDIEGEFDSMSASQRIALYRIVQEGLANVREHSKARHVQILGRGGLGGTGDGV